MELGPSHQDRIIQNPSLIDFINDCNAYVGKLSLFNKYCVWRYTIGSASVNYRLIFGSLSPNTDYWVFLFFKFFKNTVTAITGKTVKSEQLGGSFKKFLGFFNDPNSFNKLNPDSKVKVSTVIATMYDNTLMNILKNAPEVRGQGFDTYKVSTFYPGLPTVGDFRPTLVDQLPFNSVTVNNQFNFEPFVAKDKENVLFKIHIPAKTKGILYVPTDLHAYAFEHEIIMPHGIKFQIDKYSNRSISYIPPEQVNIDTIQNKNDIIMGNVYVLNEYVPCKGNGCYIGMKNMIVFDTKYIA